MKPFIFLLLLTIIACSVPQQTTDNSHRPNSSRTELPPALFYIDTNDDGIFEHVALDETPVPKQGSFQWVRDFYESIRYPALARENGITGIVILEAHVNALGIVEEVNVQKSLTQECDMEATRAFIATTQQGFFPFNYEGRPVPFKMDLSVGFWLD